MRLAWNATKHAANKRQPQLWFVGVRAQFVETETNHADGLQEAKQQQDPEPASFHKAIIKWGCDDGLHTFK